MCAKMPFKYHLQAKVIFIAKLTRFACFLCYKVPYCITLLTFESIDHYAIHKLLCLGI